MNTDLILFGAYIFLIIACLGFHEFGHAWMAMVRGDDTAKDEGRVTLNPIAHIDPFLTIVMPIATALLMGFPFGGAKPVPVAVQNLKNPKWDNLWVTLAGPAANLVLAIVFAIVLFAVFGGDVLKSATTPFAERYAELSQNSLFKVLCGLVVMNLLLVVFNLMPVPPLDGSHVVSTFLPADVAAAYQRIGVFGIVLLLVALNSGGFAIIQRPIIAAIDVMQLDPRVLMTGTVELHSIPKRYFG